jgi:hypothetical protein
MAQCPSDRNPFDDDGIVVNVVIDGVGYAWDENDNVWKEGKPENEYDDGYRKIGVLKYEDEDENKMKEKLINFVRSIKEN